MTAVLVIGAARSVAAACRIHARAVVEVVAVPSASLPMADRLEPHVLQGDHKIELRVGPICSRRAQVSRSAEARVDLPASCAAKAGANPALLATGSAPPIPQRAKKCIDEKCTNWREESVAILRGVLQEKIICESGSDPRERLHCIKTRVADQALVPVR